MADKKRLIDANALTDKCRQICADEWNKRAAPCCWSDAYEGFIEDIEEAPTVDAVEVVRCDDCKHYEFPEDGDFLGRCTCGILAVSNSGEIYPGRGFYCLYGERRPR